jgi:uncharacterized membrane protein YgcG
VYFGDGVDKVVRKEWRGLVLPVVESYCSFSCVLFRRIKKSSQRKAAGGGSSSSGGGGGGSGGGVAGVAVEDRA